MGVKYFSVQALVVSNLAQLSSRRDIVCRGYKSSVHDGGLQARFAQPLHVWNLPVRHMLHGGLQIHLNPTRNQLQQGTHVGSKFFCDFVMIWHE